MACLFGVGGTMIRPKALAAMAILLGFVPAPAQQPSTAQGILRLDGSSLTPTEIDADVTQFMKASNVTGVGIAVFHDGKISYLKAYGKSDIEGGLLMTPDSVMAAASLSKAAFATVVMKLVQNDVLDLDRPIQHYLPNPLPEYENYADLKGDDRYKKLTLRILLSHTSGFPNWRWFEEDHKLRIHFEPGTHYAYSGEGIQLAQLVVETVTGKSLTALMEEELFGPLGMTRTSMVWEARFDSDFANGYDEHMHSLGPQKRSRPGAAGSMQTTLHDYATFLSAVMRYQILDRKTSAEMFKSQVKIHSTHQFPSLAPETTTAHDAIQLSAGLGWGIYTSSYGNAFFKGGYDDGWRHQGLCFSNGTGILIMTNSSNGDTIFKPVFDSILGTTSFPFDW
jgi:CubicO group peptidase (beta-lactamase class C family)